MSKISIALWIILTAVIASELAAQADGLSLSRFPFTVDVARGSGVCSISMVGSPGVIVGSPVLYPEAIAVNAPGFPPRILIVGGATAGASDTLALIDVASGSALALNSSATFVGGGLSSVCLMLDQVFVLNSTSRSLLHATVESGPISTWAWTAIPLGAMPASVDLNGFDLVAQPLLYAIRMQPRAGWGTFDRFDWDVASGQIVHRPRVLFSAQDHGVMVGDTQLVIGGTPLESFVIADSDSGNIVASGDTDDAGYGLVDVGGFLPGRIYAIRSVSAGNESGRFGVYSEVGAGDSLLNGATLDGFGREFSASVRLGNSTFGPQLQLGGGQWANMPNLVSLLIIGSPEDVLLDAGRAVLSSPLYVPSVLLPFSPEATARHGVAAITKYVRVALTQPGIAGAELAFQWWVLDVDGQIKVSEVAVATVSGGAASLSSLAGSSGSEQGGASLVGSPAASSVQRALTDSGVEFNAALPAVAQEVLQGGQR